MSAESADSPMKGIDCAIDVLRSLETDTNFNGVTF